MKKRIKDLLKVGDVVYSAKGGEEMTVTRIDENGFETDQDYFLFREIRKLYFLTRYGYWYYHSMQKENENKNHQNTV